MVKKKEEPIVTVPPQTAGLFTLNMRDIINGLIMTVIGTVLVSIQGFLTNNAAIDWHLVLYVAEVAGISYLLKNVFTNNEGRFAGVIG